jgi:hypothetical protein
MADLLLVNADRAMAVVEVEVQTTEIINTFLEWPIRAAGPALNALPDMRIIVTKLNNFAAGDYFINNFVQNAVTGRISFDLSNGTAGAPASEGEYRIEVERVKS